MEQPPTPSSSSGYEPDLPKPPIWDEAAASIPPIAIPRLETDRPDRASSTTASAPRVPIVPDVTRGLPRSEHPATPVAPRSPTPRRSDLGPDASNLPSSGVASSSAPPVQPAARQTGPAFISQSLGATPAPGMPASLSGTAQKPQWPSAPPMPGRIDTPAAPAAPRADKPRSKKGLIALGVLLAAAVALGGFFFGRSVTSSESVTMPIAAAPTATAPTTVPDATAPPATEVPAPTPEPVLPPVNDAPSPVLPGEGADEPVAAVAQAVAPAVVLIQNELGQGSGIIYDESGLILTNAHVVGGFTEVQVTLASGVRVPGEVLGADPLTDVAVVNIDTDFEFGIAVLAPESSVEVGQLAVAIGSPFGLEQTVTSGIVSAKGRVLENIIDDGRLSVVSMIQTDAPINPGNSGGALADRQGRVIGMNTSIRTDGSGGNIGVGFAVPSDTAKLIADRIIAGEPLERGFLGINGGTPLIGEPGVVVGEVTLGSGAANAGIKADDLIVGFNGGAIKSMSDLAAAVRLQPPEATVTVEFVRDGQNLVAEVTLGLLNDQ